MMKILFFFVSLFFSGFLISYVIASPIEKSLAANDYGVGSSRSALPSRLINECMLVGVEEATYFYKSKVPTTDVCGLYLVSAPDQRIEITIDFLQVNCEAEGIVSLLDGWEMSEQVFPPVGELPMETRVTNFCGHVKKRQLLTSSNAATILYRTPTKGDIFKVSVRFLRHPKPCNILLTSEAEIVTLRNHGLRRNCTLATAFPASIKLIQLSVGIEDRTGRMQNRELESGVLTRCHKRGYEDVVLVGGSPGLDTSVMKVEELFCGLDSNPRLPWSRVLCDVTAVRLVSSGLFDNSVTVAVTPLTSLEDLPTTMCDVPM